MLIFLYNFHSEHSLLKLKNKKLFESQCEKQKLFLRPFVLKTDAAGRVFIFIRAKNRCGNFFFKSCACTAIS